MNVDVWCFFPDCCCVGARFARAHHRQAPTDTTAIRVPSAVCVTAVVYYTRGTHYSSRGPQLCERWREIQSLFLTAGTCTGEQVQVRTLLCGVLLEQQQYEYEYNQNNSEVKQTAVMECIAVHVTLKLYTVQQQHVFIVCVGVTAAVQPPA